MACPPENKPPQTDMVIKGSSTNQVKATTMDHTTHMSSLSVSRRKRDARTGHGREDGMSAGYTFLNENAYPQSSQLFLFEWPSHCIKLARRLQIEHCQNFRKHIVAL